MKLTKKEMNQLISLAATDMENLLAAEDGAPLAKADPGQEAPGESPAEGSSATPPGSEAPEAPPEGPPDASPEGSPDGSPDASPEAAGDPAAQAEASPEALQAEYATMPPEELKMHLMAAQAAYMAMMGSDQGSQAPGPEASPPAGPPADASMSAPPGPPPGPPPPMGKGEFDDKSGKVKAGTMAKSEFASELADLRKTIADQARQLQEIDSGVAAQVAQVAEGIKRLVEKPMRKSLTGVSYVGKPGATPEVKSDFTAMKKSEVNERLRDITSSRRLAEPDQHLIASYQLGKVGVDKIVHILESK